jgi:hypothetical protein
VSVARPQAVSVDSMSEWESFIVNFFLIYMCLHLARWRIFFFFLLLLLTE